MHLVLLESRDMGSTGKKNEYSTAQILKIRRASYNYRECREASTGKMSVTINSFSRKETLGEATFE